ncbi:hypothetical protein AK830_g8026 [Neonectria ditissima]|uniref:Integral membrane protein n=1 Tax=Neonectria ditissima TaxID=78410 RepID=A0A0P7AVK2_9HYPO|nr:hypothetical protein AK830_g8026 [Neonectria ditissima]
MALNLTLPRHTGAIILLVVSLPLILAHGDKHDEGQMEDHEVEHHELDKPDGGSQHLSTYYSYTEHIGMIYTHIALTTVAWAFILPVAVMISLARSRYTFVLQLIFLTTNALGLLLGTLYNAQTPDLYPNNAHHKLGWIVTWIVLAQVLVTAVGWFARSTTQTGSNLSRDTRTFLHVPSNAAYESQCRPGYDYLSSHPYRMSDDSGQGTDPNTGSLRSNFISSLDGVDDVPLENQENEYDDDEEGLEDMPHFRSSPANTFRRYIGEVVTSRGWNYISFGNRVIDRIILPFGFVVFTSGLVTFGRFFEGFGIYNGLAHWVKGGVIFWLGLITLGRWSGSFAEVGWAWNVCPKRAEQKWRPSAEFVESALIFFYGSVNIFLEHLSG